VLENNGKEKGKANQNCKFVQKKSEGKHFASPAWVNIKISSIYYVD
jgi:hypothetical protein